MPWTPESGQQLTSGPVKAIALSASSSALWNEYLSGYFNGQLHSLHNGAGEATFPNVKLAFNQVTMPQPLDGAHINIITMDPGKLEGKQIGGTWTGWQRVMLAFHVRAAVTSKPQPDGKNAEYLAQEAADLLYALLTDRGASGVLQNKGFRLIRPWGPRPVPNTEYRLRIIQCSVRYDFGMPASYPLTSALGGD
jgi:hypothetical protein